MVVVSISPRIHRKRARLDAGSSDSLRRTANVQRASDKPPASPRSLRGTLRRALVLGFQRLNAAESQDDKSRLAKSRDNETASRPLMGSLCRRALLPCEQAHATAGLPYDHQQHPSLQPTQALNSASLPESRSDKFVRIHSRQSSQPCGPLNTAQVLGNRMPDQPALLRRSPSPKRINARSTNNPGVKIKREHGETPIVMKTNIPPWSQDIEEYRASSSGTSTETESESASETLDHDFSDSSDSSDTTSVSRLLQTADGLEETSIPPTGHALSHVKDFTLHRRTPYTPT